jgi:serine/threonine protein kinase
MLPRLPRIGDVIGGRFRVVRIIARGAMSTVVEARHVRHGGAVAIKLLPSGLGQRAAARLEREARFLANLRNDHVARIFGVGVLDDGTPYLVMELLTGGDMAALLATEGPLPTDEAIAYILQASRGVAEAHARGIVHRDLKPANLFLTTTRSGAPCLKVLDFGVSKVNEGSAAATAASRDHVVGTPLYMAPEQFSTPAEVDARADVWSLGVCLFELLTGEVPFKEKTILRQYALLITKPAQSVCELRADVPAAVAQVILRCLRRDPKERYATATDLANALEAASPAAAALARGGTTSPVTTDRVSRLSTLRAVVAALDDGLESDDDRSSSETRRFDTQPSAIVARRSRAWWLARCALAASFVAMTGGLVQTFRARTQEPIVLYAPSLPDNPSPLVAAAAAPPPATTVVTAPINVAQASAAATPSRPAPKARPHRTPRGGGHRRP